MYHTNLFLKITSNYISHHLVRYPIRNGYIEDGNKQKLKIHSYIQVKSSLLGGTSAREVSSRLLSSKRQSSVFTYRWC